MNAYNLVLSDDKTVRVEAHSAADAIARAIDSFRGRTVTRCYQGFDAQTPGYGVGGTEYDVPPHHAISHDAEKKRAEAGEVTIPFPFFK